MYPTYVQYFHMHVEYTHLAHVRSLHTCSNNCQMHAVSELHLLIFVRDMHVCTYMCVCVEAWSVVSVQVPAHWWGSGDGTLLHSELFSIREIGMYWYWLHLYIKEKHSNLSDNTLPDV